MPFSVSLPYITANKMKKIYLMMMLALVSCIQETQEQRRITVSLEQVAVKSMFSSDRGQLLWENGDRIGIYHDASGVQNTVLEYNGDPQMSLALPTDAGYIYSVFPYSSSAGETPHNVSVTIPSGQTQTTPGKLTGGRWPMTASAAIEDEHATLLFSPLTALLALNIYSSEPENGEAVTSVRITPTVNSNFCGQASIDITSGATFCSGDSSRPITLSVSDPKPLVSEKPDRKLFEDQLYVSIARQSYTYVKFDIYTSAGKLYSITSNAEPINTSEYDVTALNINLSKGEINIVQQTGTEEMVEVDGTHSFLESLIRDPMAGCFTEDIIPDFSRVGYHYGDDEIPSYTNVIATLEPTGDDTDRAADIQAALDKADGSTNSVVLLKAGDYHISSQININKSHLVLRGEGGGRNDADRTRLIATGDGTMSACLRLGDKDGVNPVVDAGSLTEISESYVPVGRLSLNVNDASSFNIGDRIYIYRPATPIWIHDIRMDAISDMEVWNPDLFHIYQERVITGISGNVIMLDAPIVMALDSYYGGGYVVRIHKERVVESGIENIFIESEYDETVTKYYTSDAIVDAYGRTSLLEGAKVCVDEDHCRDGVKVVHCEHCWVKGVSGQHFIFSLVGLGQGSRNVTVEDCHSYEPVSLIQGSRRYAFNANDKTTMGLFKGCTAEYDRHQFVTTALSTGPLVFTGCSATKCLGETGPHCQWASGVLYDCITLDSRQLSVQDSDFTGTGASHGWQGANIVFWNCKAPKIVCQSPWTGEGRNPSGTNYCIGSIGTKTLSTVKVSSNYLNDRPQGKWIPDPGSGGSNSSHVTSGTYYGATANGLSLYEAQLEERRSSGTRVLPSNWYK